MEVPGPQRAAVHDPSRRAAPQQIITKPILSNKNQPDVPIDRRLPYHVSAGGDHHRGAHLRVRPEDQDGAYKQNPLPEECADDL